MGGELFPASEGAIQEITVLLLALHRQPRSKLAAAKAVRGLVPKVELDPLPWTPLLTPMGDFRKDITAAYQR